MSIDHESSGGAWKPKQRQQNQYHNGNFQQTNRALQRGSQEGSSSGMNQQNQGFIVNMAQKTQRTEEPQRQPSQSMNSFPPRQAHLVAFKTTTATISHKKSNVSFIDSGQPTTSFMIEICLKSLKKYPQKP